MSIAIVLVSWVLACCAVLVVLGLVRIVYTAGYSKGRQEGHDDALTAIYEARTELVPYAAEHFDARGQRRVH